MTSPRTLRQRRPRRHVRASAARVVLLGLIGLPVPQLAAYAAEPTPLDLCRSAFAGRQERLAAAFPPAMAGESLDDVFERIDVAAMRKAERAELEHMLPRLRRAVDLGHLPSRYLLATLSIAEGQVPLDGMLDEPARERLIEELARQTFALAEYHVAFRTKDEGFFPKDRFEPGFDAHAAAMKRWSFFRWMTLAGLHGLRSAWESLADFYALQIDQFDSTAEDRVRGYAWEHLRNLPVYDWEKSRTGTQWWESREQAAWRRLRDAEEQAEALALATHYEKSLFPHVLYDLEPEAICALAPQFADESVAARQIQEPVGPPPPIPEPKSLGPRPMPEAPEGIRVIANRLRPGRDVEYDAPIVLAEIAPGDEGFLERVICAVRDAPILQREGGTVSVNVVLERKDGERVTLCAFFPSFAVLHNRPLVPHGVPLRSGDVVNFSCRSFLGKALRGPSGGCAVDVDLWVSATHGTDEVGDESPPAP